MTFSTFSKTPTTNFRSTTFLARQDHQNQTLLSATKRLEALSPKLIQSKASIKQVRYDIRQPTEFNSSAHPRTSSEHSYLYDRTHKAQIGESFEKSKTSTLGLSPRTGIRWASRESHKESKLDLVPRRVKPEIGNTHYIDDADVDMIKPVRKSAREVICSPAFTWNSNLETDGVLQEQKPSTDIMSLSDYSSDTIKQRLLEDYYFNRSKQFHKLTTPTDTASRYKEHVMDWGSTSRTDAAGYSSESPVRGFTGMKGLGYSKSTGQPSPSSVIEELQGRFFNKSSRSREKRTTLTNTNTADLLIPVYHRKTATPLTTTVKLASRPHHQSELTLPTTTATHSPFEPYFRPITAASTVRLASDLQRNSVSQPGGPSFRRLQTMYGSTSAQKRYPSDNALDKSYISNKTQQSLLTPQFPVTGGKTGTVKIHVRSRSEQTSPMQSPNPSLRSVFGNNDWIRSKTVIQPKTVVSASRTYSSPPGRRTNYHFADETPAVENDDSQMLPSVREIIRQVEEMTLKNNNSTHNSISTLPRHHQCTSNTSHHISRSLMRPVNTNHCAISNRSQSVSSLQSNEVPPGQHPGRGYDTISSCPQDVSMKELSTARREWLDCDTKHFDNFSTQGVRKTDQLMNLPQDYQKLLEAFLEQRKDIQRLRKEIADKEQQISSLQKDIRLYEPWR